MKETEDKVRQIQNNFKIAQSRQKSYADRRRRPLRFAKGDHVYLKVSPMKGVNRFGVKGKLAPRYIGPFLIIDQCGQVAYRLKLPERLSWLHNVSKILKMWNLNRIWLMQKNNYQVVQGAMESALWGRSYMGIWRLSDGELSRVSRFSLTQRLIRKSIPESG